MTKSSSENLRMKRKYLLWLEDARGLSEATVDKAAAAVDRFEAYTKGRPFKRFHTDLARGFKRHLESAKNPKTGRSLSAASIDQTLRDLKAFFCWLADQPGYKSRIRHSDAQFFTPSRRTAKSARGACWRPHPSLSQLRHVLRTMPSDTVFERRDRAVIAFLFMTGARDGSAATLRLRNLDLVEGCAHFEGRDVETKFGKAFTTWFLPVGSEPREIFEAWVSELRKGHLWGPDDPVFPRTKVGLSPERRFAPIGLDRAPWSNGTRICQIFRNAFRTSGLPEFPAHRVRHTLSEIGSRVCKSPEELKAWSQNLGHEDVMTTLSSYGTVAQGRQAELLRNMVLVDE